MVAAVEAVSDKQASVTSGREESATAAMPQKEGQEKKKKRQEPEPILVSDTEIPHPKKGKAKAKTAAKDKDKNKELQEEKRTARSKSKGSRVDKERTVPDAAAAIETEAVPMTIESAIQRLDVSSVTELEEKSAAASKPTAPAARRKEAFVATREKTKTVATPEASGQEVSTILGEKDAATIEEAVTESRAAPRPTRHSEEAPIVANEERSSVPEEAAPVCEHSVWRPIPQDEEANNEAVQMNVAETAQTAVKVLVTNSAKQATDVKVRFQGKSSSLLPAKTSAAAALIEAEEGEKKKEKEKKPAAPQIGAAEVPLDTRHEESEQDPQAIAKALQERANSALQDAFVAFESRVERSVRQI